MLQRQLNGNPKQEGIWNTLGVAQYRGGIIERRLNHLRKRNKLSPRKNLGFNAVFLAMAHWQLGNQEEGLKWYDKAVEWIEKNRPDDKELGGFRAEAQTLLNSGGEMADERKERPNRRGAG